MKVCVNCGRENKYKNSEFCRRCKENERKDKMTPRKCGDCGKEYKSFLSKCPSCYRKDNIKKTKGTPCSVCNRTDVLIYRKRDYICVMCWRKKKIEENPDYKNKRTQWQRKHDRKKSGRELDSPLLVAPAGSGHIDKTGYKRIPGYIDEMGYRRLSRKGHPNASKTGKNKYRVTEHAVVMSEHLGRPLRKGESIHHKNGIRHDNRMENLELWDKRQPAGQRVEDKIKFYKEFLEEHGYEVTLKQLNY